MTIVAKTSTRESVDRRMLDLAARCAWRAAGRVEPNPMVGCVIGRADGAVLACGHHRAFGGAHAEVDAIRSAAANGVDLTGATAWVTLEPCNTHGKTPPCVRALLDAGIGEVVIAAPDPSSAGGGGAALTRAGVRVRWSDASAAATLLSAPFRKRQETGLPWVVAKWAQSIDGRIATRTGESQWISCERSRAETHRWRGRVDAMLVGVGTVLQDNPRLTARDVRPPRRVARRVVFDPRLRTPADCALVETVDQAPLTLVCAEDVADSRAASALRARGVDLLALPPGVDGRPDPREALRRLALERDISTVLVEGGPTLLGALLREDLIDMAAVFVAPVLMADASAPGAATGIRLEHLHGAKRFHLQRAKPFDDDMLLVYAR
jgi:diaminohydroxyphosphoribosylaminopyrimidine deaminase/5-amino-6-(5-phosphoribosylamino)uracil reductase